ncbi:hypothetical protein EQG66_00915 [Sphingobium fluviale]|uniref:Uncharacterized protein n=1 Tax=Sphingobium fluviale TaxID=2506423 RepID=A0A4Q1KPR4_9SPHN|nr:hypothetical protein EQG66_00915 [Sphingobium fluviale]
MTDRYLPSALSPRLRHLSTFENAYRVAVQRRRSSGRDQFIVSTGDPVQPFRATSRWPESPERLLARVA